MASKWHKNRTRKTAEQATRTYMGWTAEEDQFVIDQTNQGITAYHIAILIHRTDEAVRARRAHLGITRHRWTGHLAQTQEQRHDNKVQRRQRSQKMTREAATRKYAKWTTKEVQLLWEWHSQKVSAVEIALRLKRTQLGVESQILKFRKQGVIQGCQARSIDP